MLSRSAAIACLTLLCGGCATAGPVETRRDRVEASGYGRATTADANCHRFAELATDWQALLGLGDWRIVLYCAPRTDVPANAVGESRASVLDRVAAVWIRPDAPDAETAIVHELMHLFTALICSSQDDAVVEPGLRALVRALRR